jgi:short-subunit dehydrogenase
MRNLDALLPQNNWIMGKKVLITGATSGIGKALALMLSKNDTTVIAHGRSEARLKSLPEEGEKENILTVTGDLGVEEGWRAVESAILEKQPDALVLNAGYNCRKDYASGWKDPEVFEMIQVNMISPILCARTFVGLPKLSYPRRLVLILSTSCHFPRQEMSLYIAAKTGLMGFGKALQQEGKTLGVRTILLYPGRTNTNFRKIPHSEYMDPESVAYACASLLCLPEDIVPYEFTFRPECDTII